MQQCMVHGANPEYRAPCTSTSSARCYSGVPGTVRWHPCQPASCRRFRGHRAHDSALRAETRPRPAAPEPGCRPRPAIHQVSTPGRSLPRKASLSPFRRQRQATAVRGGVAQPEVCGGVPRGIPTSEPPHPSRPPLRGGVMFDSVTSPRITTPKNVKSGRLRELISSENRSSMEASR